VLIGDVIVAARAYVGPCACLRGDFGRIVVEEGANVQDSCLLHGFPGKDTVVGAQATVGHGAVLHGCVVRRGALIGMNAVVNDNAEVGEEAMVAALAFVKAEHKIAPRSLVAGIPARELRPLTQQELRWKSDNMLLYQALTRRSAATLRETEALTAIEPGRRRIDIPGAVPLSELKAANP
jgi:phenylacetic acid degradation protein